jgi:hypothetical protein
MNWFKRIFCGIRSLFVIFSKTAMAVAVDQIYSFVESLVEELEDRKDLSNSAKALLVKNATKAKYDNISSSVINCAINMAIGIIRDKLK